MSFVAGLVIAAVVAALVVKKIVKARTEQAEMSVKLQMESSYKTETVALQSELKHSEERVKELQEQLEDAKTETAQQLAQAKAEAQESLAGIKEEAARVLAATKDELAQRHKEDIAVREEAHKKAMESLQQRFDETVSKVTAQVKAETNEMLKAIRQEVDALYIPGTRYRKTGVVFFGLEKVGSARQLDLFSPVEKSEASPLYKAIDALNKRYGKGKVFSAAEGLGDRSWKMKRTKLSKRPTTRWDELMTVR